MGVLDFFRGKGGGRNSALTPEQLRVALFDAAAARDGRRLAALCQAHEATVLAQFPRWRTVPVELRRADKLSWYGGGLIAVAEHFAQRRGNPGLIALLTGSDDENPMLQCQRTLAAAEPLMAALEYTAAADRIRARLLQLETLRGDSVCWAIDRYQPVLLGRLGECQFQLGDSAAAIELFERARTCCEAVGDHHGVLAYLGDLYEVLRYRGDSAGATARLEQRVSVFAQLADPRQAADAARARRQLAIMRAGEPLCRVVVEAGGQTLELAELAERAPPAGALRFVFVRNRLALRRASQAVEAGVHAAAQGKLEAALSHFERARLIDAYDPWPHYHAALVLVELRRYADAVERYRATELRAPGWYHCRAALWLAEQLAAGTIDHGTFDTVRKLVAGKLAPADAVVIAEAALARCELPALRLALGNALGKLGQADDAEAEYRHGLAGGDEPDVRTRLLVALASGVHDERDRERYLREAVELGGNLVSAATAAVMLASRGDKLN